MTNLSTISIGVGLGDLRFGATPDDIEAQLGQPSDRYDRSTFGAELRWDYPDEQIRLYFDTAADALSIVTVTRRDAILYGKYLIGRNPGRVRDRLADQVLGPREVIAQDPDDPMDYAWLYPNLRLQFEFQQNQLLGISFAPLNPEGNPLLSLARGQGSSQT